MQVSRVWVVFHEAQFLRRPEWIHGIHSVVLGGGDVVIQMGSIKGLPIFSELLEFFFPQIPIIQKEFFSLGNVPGGHVLKGHPRAVVVDIKWLYLEKGIPVSQDTVLGPPNFDIGHGLVVVDVINARSQWTQYHARFWVRKAIVQQELFSVRIFGGVSYTPPVRAGDKIVHVEPLFVPKHQEGRPRNGRSLWQIPLCKGSGTSSFNGGALVDNMIDAFPVLIEPIDRTSRIGLEKDPNILVLDSQLDILPRKIV
mmetsp:Transcript_12825/g.32319  ORF Transcript_12825/g.32319 Transcript_12825/m.32319 type:complete len:254 (-) Transcript_12825:300-1061(-)